MGASFSNEIEPVDMKGREALLVRAKIKENCIMIFSKTHSPSCTVAKEMFDKLGVAYGVMELDKHKDGVKIQDVLHEMTGRATVPGVFIAGHFIGGGKLIKHMFSNGQLYSLVYQCDPKLNDLYK